MGEGGGGGLGPPEVLRLCDSCKVKLQEPKKVQGQGYSNINSNKSQLQYFFASLMFTYLSNPFFLSTKLYLKTTRFSLSFN